MKTTGKVALVAVTCGALIAGLAMAGPARRQPTEREAAPYMLGTGGLEMLFAAEAQNVEVRRLDEGVELVLTAGPDAVERLQERVESRVQRLNQLALRMEMRGGAPPNAPLLLSLVAEGDLDIDTEETANGVNIALTSGEPDVVRSLQENMPKWALGSRERATRARATVRRMAEEQPTMRLLASEKVKIQTAELETGIVLTVTSPDPQVAAEIKREVPGGLNALRSFARRVAERRQQGQQGEQRPPRAGQRRGGRFRIPTPPED
jgi:hypothetical protein